MMSCWKCGTNDCDDCGTCQICGIEMDGNESNEETCDLCAGLEVARKALNTSSNNEGEN